MKASSTTSIVSKESDKLEFKPPESHSMAPQALCPAVAELPPVNRP